MSLFQRHLEKYSYLFKEISILGNEIQKAIDLIVNPMGSGHKLLLCGGVEQQLGLVDTLNQLEA